MELLKDNLEKELFKIIQLCEEELIIISPYISLNVAKRLIQTIKSNAINCTIITRFERKSFVEKASSLDAIKSLVENGVQILTLKDVHSKLYLIDSNKAFVGSANFTNKGLNTNHELLLYFDDKTETDKFYDYAHELIVKIKQAGNFTITLKQIEKEEDFIQEYKRRTDEKEEELCYSWGANLDTENDIDENSVVLSVPAGSTIHLIEKYYVHAHPISSGYNYTPTDFITFRKPKGGVMDTIYKIDHSFPIEMKEWRTEIEKLDISETTKEKLMNYIVNRYKDFEFEKAPKYKFYLVSFLCDLPNEPRPPINNAGGWLYRYKDLVESKQHVNTISQMKK